MQAAHAQVAFPLSGAESTAFSAAMGAWNSVCMVDASVDVESTSKVADTLSTSTVRVGAAGRLPRERGRIARCYRGLQQMIN